MTQAITKENYANVVTQQLRYGRLILAGTSCITLLPLASCQTSAIGDIQANYHASNLTEGFRKD